MAEKQPESEAAPQERDRRSLLSVSETFHATPDKQLQEVDIFRDTFVRYLGYANEVGESFRALVHVNVVRFSYVVASGYVVADSIHKGSVAAKLPDDVAAAASKNTRVMHAVVDSLIWQGLASVIVPGFTINRICWASAKLLNMSTSLPAPVRKWTTTAIGLTSIPFIIKPIDQSVHYVMDGSVRKFLHIGPDPR